MSTQRISSVSRSSLAPRVTGASSQSEQCLITNKPQLDEFSAGIDGNEHHLGEDSNKVEAMINIPLSDRAAIRFVGFADKQGGWIDNLPGTFLPAAKLLTETTQWLWPFFKVSFNDYSVYF